MTTMNAKDQKTLTQAIQANRRALSLLDKRIDDLVKRYPSVLSDFDVEQRQPFFYGAVGSDGQLGMEVTAANVGENPSYGYIRTHPDSAFVLTRICAGLTRNPGASVTFTTSYQSYLGLGFRLYDESSSRWITFTNHNNEPQQKAVFPAAAFSPYPAYNEGGFDMPTECVFPRSAVIRVEAYVQDLSIITPPGVERLQVVFSGYKVYGG